MNNSGGLGKKRDKFEGLNSSAIPVMIKNLFYPVTVTAPILALNKNKKQRDDTHTQIANARDMLRAHSLQTGRGPSCFGVAGLPSRTHLNKHVLHPSPLKQSRCLGITRVAIPLAAQSPEPEGPKGLHESTPIEDAPDAPGECVSATYQLGLSFSSFVQPV